MVAGGIRVREPEITRSGARLVLASECLGAMDRTNRIFKAGLAELS